MESLNNNVNKNLSNLEKLQQLRQNGVFKIEELDEQEYVVKKNKFLSKLEKKTKIKKIKDEKLCAKEDIALHKAEIAEIIKDEVQQYVPAHKAKEKELIAENKEKVVEAKRIFKEKYSKIKEEHSIKLNELKSLLKEIQQEYKTAKATLKNLSIEELSAKETEFDTRIINAKSDIKSEINSYKSKVRDIKSELYQAKQEAKDSNYEFYNERRNHIKRVKNNHFSISEKIEYSLKTSAFNFNLKKFFLNNALYFVILLIFIYTICVDPTILSISSIVSILEQSSTRMFLALGVAGLILLGGTDLSIGRMVGMGAMLTAMILHTGDASPVSFFGLTVSFANMPGAVRFILALVLSVTLCTAFSALAGFFTAKFKMHPFITTLSTQLIIFGLLFVATTGTSTGGSDQVFRELIMYKIGGFLTVLILYAIIAIAVVWFIWNKTKFGKNMYAVGGNPEAASVSGISVFKVTMGVFIMAGILYGLGSFLEGLRAQSSGGTGSGWELDAIAACVVGGISFSGGIGKIKGAVFGVIIFTGLTYCLSYIGMDQYYQFIFKGIIIMAAVALDCVKYLKKK